jgi:hypothetical protein
MMTMAAKAAVAVEEDMKEWQKSMRAFRRYT